MVVVAHPKPGLPYLQRELWLDQAGWNLSAWKVLGQFKNSHRSSQKIVCCEESWKGIFLLWHHLSKIEHLQTTHIVAWRPAWKHIALWASQSSWKRGCLASRLEAGCSAIMIAPKAMANQAANTLLPRYFFNNIVHSWSQTSLLYYMHHVLETIAFESQTHCDDSNPKGHR